MTDPLFTADQLTERERFSEFAKNAILPHAFEIDRSDILLPEITRSLAQAELFGRLLLNGRDRRNGLITYGLLHEELGRICCSARSLVTVQDIVLTVLCRWGSSEQRSIWVDSLLRGETIAAFAICLLAVIVQMGYTMIIGGGIRVMGPSGLVMPSLVIVIAAALLWFSWFARSRNW